MEVWCVKTFSRALSSLLNYITTLLYEDKKWHCTVRNCGKPIVDSVDMKLVHNEIAYQNQSPQNSKGFFQIVLLHFKFQMTKCNKHNVHISYHTIFI